MAESARQLLEGIARALSEDVSPHVDDRFAEMQCKAAAELLANLATELEWAREPIQQRNEALRGMLEALRQSGWQGRPAPADDLAPEQVRDALLAELSDGLRWLSEHAPGSGASIDALLREDLERQVAGLRRGMFR
jgi:hypothetical protein